MAKFKTIIYIDRDDSLKKLAMIREKKLIGIMKQLKEIEIGYNTFERMMAGGKKSVSPEAIKKVLRYIRDNESLIEPREG